MQEITLKTKSAVIAEAVKVLNHQYPLEKRSTTRFEQLIAVFTYLCEEIPEDRPDASADVICNFVQRSLALCAN